MTNCDALQEKKNEYQRRWREKNREHCRKYNENRREYKREHYQANREKVRERSRKWYSNNREKACERSRKYHEDNKEVLAEKKRDYIENNREVVAERKRKWQEDNRKTINGRVRQWRRDNRDRINKKKKERYHMDVQHKIQHILRSRLRLALRSRCKTGSAVRDLGCSIDELRLHLEAQFRPGMSWNNWTLNGWHIDHILPLASFDLTDRDEFLQAAHYTNLQPLWAQENLSKGAKYSMSEKV